MRFNKIFSFSLLFLICVIYFNVFTLTDVTAYQSGDFYICDFQQYADGDWWINESISGEVWLQMKSTSATNNVEVCDLGNGEKKWGIDDDDNGYDTHFRYWIYTYSDNISFEYDYASINQPSYIKQEFYIWGETEATDDPMITLEYGGTGGSNYVKVIIDGVSTNFGAGSGVFCPDQQINVLLEASNSSYHVQITNGSGVIKHVWGENPSEFGFLGYCYGRVYNNVASNCDYYVDNLTVSSSEIGLLWGVDYPSYGSVLLDGDQTDYELTQATSIDYFDLEIENSNFFESQVKEIKQVALALTNYTDISDIAGVNLRINDIAVGSYDIYYPYGDKYILVWQNINQDISENDITCEFLVTKDAGTSPTFSYISKNSDVDGDGDKRHKYTGDNPSKWNGFYDGDFTENYDFVYEVWYELEDIVAEEYGDLKNYSSWGDVDGSYAEYCYAWHDSGYPSIWDAWTRTDPPPRAWINESSHSYEGLFNDYFSGRLRAFDWVISKDSYDQFIDAGGTATAFGNYFSLHLYSAEYRESNQFFTETYTVADYVIPFSSQWVILRWVFDTPIDVDQCIIGYALRWVRFGNIIPCIALADFDNNEDGMIEYKTSVSANMFNDYGYNGDYKLDYDLVTELYYEKEYYRKPINYTDYIETDKISYKQYENVQVTGHSLDDSMVTQVKAYNNSGSGWSEYTGQGFPRSFVSNEYGFTFSPPYSGQWNVTLERSDTVMDSAWFNVSAYDPTYGIVAYPNPSYINDEVTIEVMYNISDSYQVRLRCLASDQTYYIPITTKQAWHVAGSIRFKAEGIYYIEMQRRENSSYDYGHVTELKHVCKARDYDNWLELAYTQCDYQELNGRSACEQTISYQHNYLGFNNVKVIINDNLSVYDVGSATRGEIKFIPPEDGWYNVSLVYRHNDGTLQYLCNNASFLVGEAGRPQGESDAQLRDVFDRYFTEEQQTLLGLSILLFFLILPAYICYKWKIRDMNSNVYILTTVVGFAIDIYLGLFPFWVLVLFIFLFTALFVWKILDSGLVRSSTAFERERTLRRESREGQAKRRK